MNIVIKTTTACNFRCVYCSEGDREPVFLDEALFRKLADELPELLDKIGHKKVTFLWHGGEPCLWGRERLERCMAYAKEQLAGYEVSFIMQSNGYLINDSFMDLFKRFNVRVGISMDGYREMHDANRPARDGSPTFDRVLQGVKTLDEAGLCGGILLVINTENPPDTEKLFSFIREAGVSVRINPLIACGRSAGQDTAAVDRNYVRVLQDLFEKSMTSDAEVTIDPLHGILNAIIAGCPVNECSYSGACAWGIISLYADGLMGYCGRDSRTLSCAYGSLRNSTVSQLYFSDTAELMRQRDSYLKTHDCKTCKVWDLCHGGCTYTAMNSFGDLNRKTPSCETRRELISYLKTTGLSLLKEHLVRKKREIRECLKAGKSLLSRLETMNAERDC
ncbi:radical SAM protein [Succinimonas sp.]|uniref:radical SAM protein n=1 Tax=Succinimonas sp. TaxID=1936151 RepID=UPI00386BD395